MQKMQQKPKKGIFNRLVRCQEFKIISIRLEIRNQHVEMHQIPSIEEKSATSSAKPVSLLSSDKTVWQDPGSLGSHDFYKASFFEAGFFVAFFRGRLLGRERFQLRCPGHLGRRLGHGWLGFRHSLGHGGRLGSLCLAGRLLGSSLL